jgi:hypothetical protein
MSWFSILKMSKFEKFAIAANADGLFWDRLQYTEDFPEGRPADNTNMKRGHFRFFIFQDEVDWKTKNEEPPFMAPRLNVPYADIFVNKEATDFKFIAGDKDFYNRLRNLWDGIE